MLRNTLRRADCAAIWKRNSNTRNSPAMSSLFHSCVCAVSVLLFACRGEPAASNDTKLVPAGIAGSSQAGLKLFETSPGSGKGMVFEGPPVPGNGYYGGYPELRIKSVAIMNYPAPTTYGNLRREGPEQAYYLNDDLVYSFHHGFTTISGDTYPTRFIVVSLSEKRFIPRLNVEDKARKIYGLSPSQMFRGKVGTRIFFQERQNHQVILCRAVSGGPVTSYALRGSVEHVLGVIGKSADAITVITFEKLKAFIRTGDFTEYDHDVQLSSFK